MISAALDRAQVAADARVETGGVAGASVSGGEEYGNGDGNGDGYGDGDGYGYGNGNGDGDGDGYG